MFVNYADIEIDQTGARDVDPNGLDGEPEEKLLGGDAREVGNLAVAEDAGDGDVVPDRGLEHGGAGVGKVELEAAGDVVEVKVAKSLREEANRKGVGGEELVD